MQKGVFHKYVFISNETKLGQFICLVTSNKQERELRNING